MLKPMGTVTSLTSDNAGTLDTIIKNVNTVLSVALGLLTTGVIILAIFIAYKFFTAEDKDKRNNAKAQLIYAIIGVIVMIALMILAPQITNAVRDNITNASK